MKKYKYPSHVFTILAILLSDAMCATAAYAYCNMQWGIQYCGYSAPAGVAFLFIIPYAAGIAVCAILASAFYKRRHKIM